MDIPNPTTALIDIDQLVYASAIKADENELDDYVMTKIFKTSVANRQRAVAELLPSVQSYILFVSGSHNFRKRLATEKKYKGNRPPRPTGYNVLMDYAKNELGALFDKFLEADDMTAMRHYNSHVRGTYDTVLVDVDKDLDQIPGHRIVPELKRGGEIVRQQEYLFIDEDLANRSFYLQLITGDSTDNINGIKGLGLVKAGKLLGDSVTAYELWNRVMDVYFDHKSHAHLTRGDIVSMLISRSALLYMKRGREDVFIPPLPTPTGEQK